MIGSFLVSTALSAQALTDIKHSFFDSPVDFRSEVIYFLIVDRFHDGHAAEAKEGSEVEESKGLYDKTHQDWGKYWGGNLQGIINKIDYLKELGVTALWLSPLFEQVSDLQFSRAPMHGYWTRDFKRINPRFLKVDEPNTIHNSPTMKTLVDTCHAAGIKVVLDIVCNHSSPDINGSKGLVLDDGKPIADFNNDTNGFYYHEGEITDWEDEYQLIHLEMMGLATFNEKNIDYRNYIKSAIRTWLDAGIDALRVDTLKHMPIWFWQEFTTAMKAYKPGLFMFGEYGFSKPWEQRSVDYANNIGMSILDFGLCDGIRFCFSGQEPGGFHQVERVLAYDKVYHKANELVTFIDNHDMPRFLSIVPDEKKLDLALVMLLTIRGVPCLFYGTEQYLNNATNGGQDPYNRPMMDRWDTQAHPYQLVRTLLQLRSSNQALAFGSHQTAWVNDDFYLYTRNFRDSAVMVMVNKTESDHVVNAENIHMPNGVYSCLLTGFPVEIVDGCLQGYTVPGNTALVISVDGKPVEAPLVAVFQINGFETQPGQSLAIIGDCDELGNWDHANSYGMEFLNDNTWIATVGFSPTQPKVINFKFIVHNSNGDPIVEYLINRKSVLPREGRIAIDCFWNSAN